MADSPVQVHIKPYIQPFERQLALAELEAISGSPPMRNRTADAPGTYDLPQFADVETLRSRLAYWERIGGGVGEPTQQAGVEATSLIARNGVRIEDIAAATPNLARIKLPNKRCLRYGPHGIHEYRGKFFPQLVRALLNIAGVAPGGLLLDPMCGSGTSLVEGAASGIRSVGLDMNPLSVFVTRVKCSLLAVCPNKLVVYYTAARDAVTASGRSFSGYRNRLPERDREYVDAWFDAHVLDELDHIHGVIDTVDDAIIRDFYRVILSNILRAVSLQKVDDLRVRRETKEVPRGLATKLFIEQLEAATKAVVSYLAMTGPANASIEIYEQDARSAAAVMPQHASMVDAVIMSPPYATALPYLDTDRLSLSYLGLLPRSEHRKRDLFMIGNREVTESQRLAHWKRYQAERNLLPPMTVDLIDRVHRLNSAAQVGFRRKNLAALLAAYFLDMRSVIGQVQSMLRPGGHAYLVVGNNRTTAGAEDIEIATALHLREIAGSLGMIVLDSISMEMLVSRDIFSKNAMASEEILCLRKFA
jgi:site-specific DNA-methyltransferase (cytosine-N4-specific)